MHQNEINRRLIKIPPFGQFHTQMLGPMLLTVDYDVYRAY